MSKHLPIITGLIWIAASICFFAHSMLAGGAAITGKVVAGQYYLGMHGNFVGVSRGAYILSAVLSAAFGLSLPLFSWVMARQKSQQPTFSRLLWLGPLFSTLAGLSFCYLSLQCIVRALFGA
ncbi:MAG: hypothetical protein JWR19_2924 [Pedosphaera sp.]|nr:hypothetical protein [Pedosphaera sp.]